MKKQKKTYIDSKFSQSPVAPASSAKVQADINRLIEEKLRLYSQEIRTILGQQQPYDPQLPISIFKSESSTLELIVRYLHEAEQKSFADIAQLLQRDHRTIWHAYRRSMRRNVRLLIEKSEITIPVSLFAQRQFSPLEVLASYLHEQHQLSFAEIARLLLLSPKTVWTVYNRKQRKEKQTKNASR